MTEKKTHDMRLQKLENLSVEEIALWGAKPLRVMIDSIYQTFDDEMSDELNVAMNEILIKSMDLEKVLYEYREKRCEDITLDAETTFFIKKIPKDFQSFEKLTDSQKNELENLLRVISFLAKK